MSCTKALLWLANGNHYRNRMLLSEGHPKPDRTMALGWEMRPCLSTPECWAACSGVPLCRCAEPSASCGLPRLTSCPLSLLTSSSARILLLSACCSALYMPIWLWLSVIGDIRFNPSILSNVTLRSCAAWPNAELAQQILYITACTAGVVHREDDAYTRRSAARVCALLRCFMRRLCCCSHTRVFTAPGTSPVGAAPACAYRACPHSSR